MFVKMLDIRHTCTGKIAIKSLGLGYQTLCIEGVCQKCGLPATVFIPFMELENEAPRQTEMNLADTFHLHALGIKDEKLLEGI